MQKAVSDHQVQHTKCNIAASKTPLSVTEIPVGSGLSGISLSQW